MANLRIAELDFDEIKQNLRTFLNSQSEFVDYDFEGSGLSVLIDILAYNTHYNAYLANMLVNEMFLDSAVKRSSAVSIAKHLGYTPRSARGARAIVDITVNSPPGLPSSLTIPRYTAFTGTAVGLQTYTFYNTESVTINASDAGYVFNDVTLKEGKYYEYSFNVVSPGPSEKYEIPNQNIDTTTLTVSVQNSSIDSTTTIYRISTDILNIDSESQVYFLEENSKENYQLFFGDGVLGKKLTAGNIVRIQYLVASGVDPNISSSVSQTFTTNASIGGTSNIVISTVSNSSGATSKESIDSIKFNALKTPSQNRLVTKSDYEQTILNNYTEIESVSVWGGEDNDPPVYGKIFISLKPYSGFIVDNTLKDNILNTTLRNKNILTVSPVFVDPEYIHLNLDVLIKFNSSTTSLTSAQLIENTRTAVISFANSNLQKFEKNFYGSQLDDIILNIDPSVVSVYKKIKIQRRIEPLLFTRSSYIGNNKLKFNNPIQPGEFTSTKFLTSLNNITYTVNIVDEPDDMPPNPNGSGTLKMYTVDSSPLFLKDVGTINYATGDIELNEILVTGYPQSTITRQYQIQLTGVLGTSTTDVSSGSNQIIVLDDSVESSISGRLAGLTIDAIAV